MNELVEQAKKIIANNLYMVIATTGGDRPWVSPVYMAYDEQYNFYWVSELDTRHSRLIEKNNKVAVVIFDSKAAEGTGIGVYFEGEVSTLVDIEQIKKAIPLLYDRKHKPHRLVEDFSDGSTRRIYKVTPKKMWVKMKGDVREEIHL